MKLVRVAGVAGAVVTAVVAGCSSTQSGTGQLDGGNPSDGAVGCGANADCPSGYSCSPGGTSVGCGICIAPENPCNTDTDCTTIDDASATKPYVCGPGSGCECGIGGKTGECIPACAGPTDCGGDETC